MSIVSVVETSRAISGGAKHSITAFEGTGSCWCFVHHRPVVWQVFRASDQAPALRFGSALKPETPKGVLGQLTPKTPKGVLGQLKPRLKVY